MSIPMFQINRDYIELIVYVSDKTVCYTKKALILYIFIESSTKIEYVLQKVNI